jgi:tetratricopeptide (TPR) repeat protein/transcriptional regulator with XRE-family HTH domain
VVEEQPGLGFAELLRQLRAEAQLTQEELAEAASLSVRSVSDLERGIHSTAHKETALLLARALDLGEPVRQLFVAAARGRASATDVLAAVRQRAPAPAAAAATRTLPRDTVSFTGRHGELTQLLRALTPVASGRVVGIHAIDGMAGIGKTTLAVRAAHQLADNFPDGQFFLPLHAHTPGQRPVEPADALASLLLTAGLSAQQIPPGLEARAARWRDHVAGKRVLLLLDDAAGHDQVRPLLPGGAGSLVLITSRRRLSALDDAAQVSLDTLAPDDAAALLARLAARASSSTSGDAAVREITRLCGYLPLAIGMLASQLRNHPARTPEDLASELAAARDRLSLMYAENLSVGAAFDLSYADLNPGQQRLFRHLGLVPGPSIDAYGAAALTGTPVAAARRHLDELYDQHLIAEPVSGRFELHDLLREHARALAAIDDAAGAEQASGRLLDYYLHGALAAGRHFTPWASAYRRPPPGNAPAEGPDLSALPVAAAWLEAERPNLTAAAEHAASHGRPSHAIDVAAAISGFLSARGYHDQSAALHQGALAAAREAGDRLGEAGALAELGVLQLDTGDYRTAAASLTRAARMFDDLDDASGQAHALNQLAFLHVVTGDYQSATAIQEQARSRASDASARASEAIALTTLGLVQQLTGDHRAAAASLEQALALSIEDGSILGQAYALNSLGVVQQETGEYEAATASQQRALALFRELGDVQGRAASLNDLGLVQQETGEVRAAEASHLQALELFRELGRRLGEAEALNRLGELATRTSATRRASELHGQALAIARDLGLVFEEGRALEGLGHSYLQSGDRDRGAEHLRQALTIYQRTGVAGARRVTKALEDNGLARDVQTAEER